MKIRFFLKTLSKQYLVSAFLVGAIIALSGVVLSSFETRVYSSKAVLRLEDKTELSKTPNEQVIKTRTIDREYLLSLAKDPSSELHLNWWLQNSAALTTHLSSHTKNKVTNSLAIKTVLNNYVRFLPLGEARLEIRVSIENKRLAPVLANAIARAIIEQAQDASADSKEELLATLEAKVKASRLEVHRTEAKISESSKGQVDWAKLKITEEQLSALGHTLSQISVERAELEAALSSPEATLASQQDFLAMGEKQLALQSELQSLTRILGAKHPRILELGQELETLRFHINSKETSAKKSLEVILSAKKAQQKSIEQAVYELHERQLALSTTAESYEALREHRTSLKKATAWWNKQLAYTKTNISSQNRSYYLSVPARQSKTNKLFAPSLLGGIALIASLLYLLWGAISLSRSRRFHSLHFAKEVLSEEIVGTIPSLASVTPQLHTSVEIKALPSPHHLLEASDRSNSSLEEIHSSNEDNVILLRPEMIIEASDVRIQLPFLNGQPSLGSNVEDKELRRALRELRAEVLTNLNEQTRSICVSSAHRGEGRSLVADGLALSLANSGYRTLLLNADLSKVSTSYQQPGLAEFLENTACMSDVLCQSEVSRLYLIGSGNVSENTVDLLISKTMQSFIGSLSQLFDFVVIDSPALSENREALRLCETADASLFVIDQQKSTIDSSRVYLSKVKKVSQKLAGVVFNRVEEKKKSTFETKAA